MQTTWLPLKGLIVTDHPEEARLWADHLRGSGVEFSEVRLTAWADFPAALDPPPDLLLVEAPFPTHPQQNTLQILREAAPGLPVIVIVDPENEVAVLETLDQGIDDYLFKDRLGRLGSAVRRALERRQAAASCQMSAGNERKMGQRVLEKIIAGMNEMMIVQDPSTRIILQCSPAAERILGYRPEELVGNTTLRLYESREVYEAFGQRMRAALQRDGIYHTEQWLRRKDGGKVCAEMHAAEIRDESGRCEGYLGLIFDITERKLAEQALVESEERYRKLVEMSPDCIAVHSEGKIAYINPAGVRLMGAETADQLIGQSVLDFSPVEDRAKILERFAQMAQGLRVPFLEEKIIRPNGTIIEGEITATPIHYQGSPAFLLVGRDFTEKRRAEAALREREQQLEQILQQMPLPIAVGVPGGPVVSANPAFLDLLGISSVEHFMGSFNPVTDPFVVQKGLAEAVLRAQQGEIVVIPEMTIQPNPEWKAAYGKGVSAPKIVEITMFPVLRDTGEVWRVVTIWKDITERKTAERELERRLAELEALHAAALAGTEAVHLNDLLSRVGRIMGSKLYPDDFRISLCDDVETGAVTSATVDDSGLHGLTEHRLEQASIENGSFTRSELSVPLTIRERQIGTITAARSGSARFTEADQRLLVALAGEMGTAIEKIRLLEAEQNRRRELEVLVEVSAAARAAETREEMLPVILGRIRQVLEAQGAAVAFRDEKDEALVFELGSGQWEGVKGIQIPPGAGIAAHVAASQQLYWSSDARSDPRMYRKDFIGTSKNLLCLPLIAEGRSIGLFYLGRDAAFLPADVRLAQATIDIFVSAVHRLQLLEQTERQLQYLLALRAIDQSILAGLNLNDTLEMLLERITALLQVDAASILLYNPEGQTLKAAALRGFSPSDLWYEVLQLGQPHAGQVAKSRQMEFVPDLSSFEDSLTEKIRKTGDGFVSHIGIPLEAKGELKGVLQIFHRTRLAPSSDWMDFLQSLAGQAAIAIDNAQLFAEQQQTNQRLTAAYEDTIDGWSRALDLRDHETEGHSHRVTELTMKLAKRLGVPDGQLPHIRRGAQLHDIGKMGIPDSILLKPGPLTHEDWEIMRKHPLYALNLLSGIDFLRLALEIPYCHHEKWDGTGYPRGLKGEQIPLAARIFAVVDVWDALRSDRPYRPGWSGDEARAFITREAGRHFDPQVAQAFLDLIRGNEN